MNAKETIKALHQLKKYGISMSKDDFGVGYFSISYLKVNNILFKSRPGFLFKKFKKVTVTVN